MQALERASHGARQVDAAPTDLTRGLVEAHSQNSSKAQYDSSSRRCARLLGCATHGRTCIEVGQPICAASSAHAARRVDESVTLLLG
jgi:hypothetical protein